jgi:hypothetical protein
MHRSIATVFVAAVTVSYAAPPQPDPMSSHECKAAREELELALSDPSADRQVQAKRLALARRLAASACLGRSDTKRERSGVPDPVQTVAPPAISVPSKPPPVAADAAPKPPVAIPRAAAITVCDPAGCWDSEGRRLNNMGPFLMGPRGLCTVQGATVQCP